ncbi:hypothetical protein OSB04_027905 [Centaurea solstitialis]|uniref:BED-type domain-containing protein n=1 Tax=Centaurea solstitialis TaxID=347529 RepID=A0AA38W8Q6_9ASTR|nr:hypothetical protein OSB04_027905 [Centaurea solstitialis]
MPINSNLNTVTRPPSKRYAKCNYCKRKITARPNDGTSYLKEHFEKCPRRTTKDILLVPNNQTIRGFKEEIDRQNAKFLFLLLRALKSPTRTHTLYLTRLSLKMASPTLFQTLDLIYRSITQKPKPNPISYTN